MENILNELENVIDSYNLTADSEDLKENFSDYDVQEKQDLDEEDINKLEEDALDVEDSENITEEDDFSTYRTFSCNECSLKTNSQEILLLHMKHNKHNNRLSEAQDVEISKLPIDKVQRNGRGVRYIKASKVPKVKTERIRRKISKSRIISSKCRVCESTFPNGLALREHTKLEHPGSKVFYCSKENCDYGTNYTGNLRMHLEGFHNQGQSFNCDLCQYKTKWKPTFLEHKREKHGLYQKKSKYSLNTKAGEPIKCDQCDHVASSQKFLVIHMRTHREIKTNINCDQCNFVTHSQFGMDHHKRWTHSGKIVLRKFNCRRCEFSVSDKLELIVHRRDVHGVTQTVPKGPPKIFNCKHCSEKLLGQEKYWKHQREVHGIRQTKGQVKIFQCEHCSEKLRGKEKYRKHQREVHEIALKILKCWFCEYKTTSGVALGKHKAIEHPGAKYECSKCSLVTKEQRFLVRHMLLMHSSNEWPCDQCDKVCKNEHYLKIHKKRNHEERKYKCDKCNFTAIFQSLLKRHIEKCDKLKKVKDDDIVKCEAVDCTYETSAKRYLALHIKRVHKVKDENDIEKKKAEPQTEPLSNVQNNKVAIFKGCIRMYKTTTE